MKCLGCSPPIFPVLGSYSFPAQSSLLQALTLPISMRQAALQAPDSDRFLHITSGKNGME